jgi:cell division protein FtsB
MIQINLLPPEYRPRTGTPVGRFVAIVVGVVLVASASGAYAYTHFIELSKVRELKSVKEEEVRAKEAQRDRSLALQHEIDLYEKRRKAIQTINRSRTLWSRKLDQFFDIVASQGTNDNFEVWLDEIEVPPQIALTRGRKRPKTPENGGLFRFSGNIAMNTSAEAPALSSALFRAVTGDPETTGQRTDFFMDFIDINNPNIEIVNSRTSANTAPLDPPVVGAFRYELQLKVPEGESPARPAAPKRSAARK